MDRNSTVMLSNDIACYHCGEKIPPGVRIRTKIGNTEEFVCCNGCAAVAEFIHESGLSGYYRRRTGRPKPIDKIFTKHPFTETEVFDDELIQKEIARKLNETNSEAIFMVGELHCPACVWLIENRLKKLDGVTGASMNFATHRLQVQWNVQQVKLSKIVQTVQSLGYRIGLYNPSTFEVAVQNQRKKLLQRMGIAGLLGMQVMILAVALYFGAWSGIESEFEQLFERFSLLLTIPILMYCATPIFRGALRDIRSFSATMDVPVALGLTFAFVGSVYATIADSGEVYYDSIAMFVFFQLVARFFEQSAQQRTSDTVRKLTSFIPETANLLEDPKDINSTNIVPVVRIKANDFVLVRPGDRVPADGIIVEGASELDESIVTGETYPRLRGINEPVIGGSYNTSSPIIVKILRVSSESVLAGIERLVEQASLSKPRIMGLADKIASVFSPAVILIAIGVALYWIQSGDSQWLAYTISVLVVACPCALSLATPTALTAATRSLVQLGILVTRVNAIQSLASTNTILFDKTGTLTTGKMVLSRTRTFGASSELDCLKIAASLSARSNHPISVAIQNTTENFDKLKVENFQITTGAGVSGEIDSTNYYLGSRQYVNSHVKCPARNSCLASTGPIAILASESEILCVFEFQDHLRSDAAKIIKTLKAQNIASVLVTGDQEAEAYRIAQQTGIAKVYSECSPNDKLNLVKELQKNGSCVAMVGDGLNDGPVMAAAHTSVASVEASHAIQVNSDFVLTSSRLQPLISARRIAESTQRVIRQNILWAIVYNLVGITLAASGYVPPVVAAIGMSASSLVVVYNSLRLTREPTQANIVSVN